MEQMNYVNKKEIEKLNKEIKDYISKFDFNYLNNLLNAINNNFSVHKKDDIVLEDWSIYFENALGLYKIIGKCFYEQNFAESFFDYNKWGYYVDGKITKCFNVEKSVKTLLFSRIQEIGMFVKLSK